MWKQLLLGSALLASGLGTNGIGYAHGGTYIGPGDTRPPGGGGGGGDGGGAPSTPGPSGPASPGPSGPSGPAGPATGGSTPGGPGATGPSSSGVTVSVSLASWDFWWAFNKEPYLNLRSKVQSGAERTGSDDFFLGRGQSARAKDTLRPSEQMIRSQVVPALKNVLATERQNDIVTGALIALAKIGDIQEADGTSEFQEIIASFLRSGEQEISETAVLALGILSDARVYPMLAALMKDTPEGRALVGKEVPVRTRAFAAYGLALIGRSVDDPALLQRMAGDLIEVLEHGHYARPDIQVGALTALGLLPLDWSADDGANDESAATDRAAVLEYLHKRMAVDSRGDAGFRDRRLSAQVPIAAGRLLSGDVPESAAGIRASIQKRLLGLASSPRAATEQRQGAIIALGMIGSAAETGANRAILAGLTSVSNSAADNQSRFLALMSIAQVGSRPGAGDSPRALQDPAQRVLLKALGRGKGQKKPWAALSLGVFGHALLSNEGQLDPTVLRALRIEAAKSVRPDEIGAYAIALGLMSDGESETILRDRLDVFAQDEPRGHIAVALGLMQAKGAAEELNAIVERSKFRPTLLRQVAVGLGLLGDKSTVKGLIGMLRTARGLSAQAAVAQGLGTIGDARSVKPLIGMLDDEGLTDTARGFAAVALGIVCDKDDLPWKTPFSVNVHYRANIPTLTSPGGTGILDIL